MSEPNKPALRAADKIRETARELFYREGIRAVGVDEIVAKAHAVMTIVGGKLVYEAAR